MLRNCLFGTYRAPATNSFKHLPAFAARIWHHLTPKLCVSRRHDRRGGRACQQFSESSRDLTAVFAGNVRIQHGRARVGVSQARLSHCHRHTLPIHYAFIAMSEGVEAAALNAQLCEQGIEFAFPHQVRIPRRSSPRTSVRPIPELPPITTATLPSSSRRLYPIIPQRCIQIRFVAPALDLSPACCAPTARPESCRRKAPAPR